MTRARDAANIVSGTFNVPLAALGNIAPKVRRSYTAIRSLVQPGGSERFVDSIASHITTRTYAAIIALRYRHNGAANHGYMSGYFCQDGQEGSEQNRAYFNRAHFDWYFNDFEVEFIVPWVPTGTNSLVTQIQSSLFTGDNRYGWEIKGVLER